MSLALKALGVYCIIHALDYIPSIVGGFLEFLERNPPIANNTMVIIAVLLPLLLLLAVAFVLIHYSDALAQKLFPSSEPMYALVLAVTGVVLLVWEIPPNVMQIVINLSVAQRLENGTFLRSPAFDGAWKLGILTGLQMTIGLYLVLGSKKVARLLHKLRES
jgi:hypothetical protein